MSLLGPVLAGFTGAGQAYLARKQRQQSLKNTVDLENYRNALLMRKLKEEQKLRDQMNKLALEKHKIDKDAEVQSKIKQKQMDILKEAALHGSSGAMKQLKDMGIDVSGLKYPIGKPKPHPSPTNESVSGLSTMLTQIQKKIKKLESPYLESTQEFIYGADKTQPIGFNTAKKINYSKMPAKTRAQIIQLKKQADEIMAKLGQVRGIPYNYESQPGWNESQIIAKHSLSPQEYGPPAPGQFVLSPPDVAKIQRAGLTEYGIQQAINKFRIAHPDVKETDAQLVQRIISGLP